MKQVKDLFFRGNKIRTFVNERCQVWFNASDIAEVLEYLDAGAMTLILNDYEKSTLKVDYDLREMPIINEAGLYHCILCSQSIEAIQFQQWIRTVLPSIWRCAPSSDKEIVENASYANSTSTESIHENLEYLLNHENEAIGIEVIAYILNAAGVNTDVDQLCSWLIRDGYLTEKSTVGATKTALTQKLMCERTTMNKDGEMVVIPAFTILGMTNIVHRYKSAKNNA